jgi:hypothetical protein
MRMVDDPTSQKNVDNGAANQRSGIPVVVGWDGMGWDGKVAMFVICLKRAAMAR